MFVPALDWKWTNICTESGKTVYPWSRPPRTQRRSLWLMTWGNKPSNPPSRRFYTWRIRICGTNFSETNCPCSWLTLRVNPILRAKMVPARKNQCSVDWALVVLKAGVKIRRDRPPGARPLPLSGSPIFRNWLYVPHIIPLASHCYIYPARSSMDSNYESIAEAVTIAANEEVAQSNSHQITQSYFPVKSQVKLPSCHVPLIFVPPILLPLSSY